MVIFLWLSKIIIANPMLVVIQDSNHVAWKENRQKSLPSQQLSWLKGDKLQKHIVKREIVLKIQTTLEEGWVGEQKIFYKPDAID